MKNVDFIFCLSLHNQLSVFTTCNCSLPNQFFLIFSIFLLSVYIGVNYITESQWSQCTNPPTYIHHLFYRLACMHMHKWSERKPVFFFIIKFLHCQIYDSTVVCCIIVWNYSVSFWSALSNPMSLPILTVNTIISPQQDQDELLTVLSLRLRDGNWATAHNI